MAPIQFNTMVLESYETPRLEGGENTSNKEFVFSFYQESKIETIEVLSFCNDNKNTYNLHS